MTASARWWTRFAACSVADEPDRHRALPWRRQPRARSPTRRARCASPASTSSSSRSGWTRRKTTGTSHGAADVYAALGPYLGTTRYVNYLDHDEAGRPAADRLRPELRAPARAEDEVRSGKLLPHQRERPAELRRGRTHARLCACTFFGASRPSPDRLGDIGGVLSRGDCGGDRPVISS